MFKVNTRHPKKLDLTSLSVLIIDDQPFFRTLMSEVLRNLGVLRVLVAVDGATGLSAFEQHQPDVVITDWVMPNVDGIEFTQRIRNHTIESRRQVPIILVTANSDRAKIEQARKSGIDEFIFKPVSTRAVVDRLTEVIERPRPFLTTRTYIGPCRRRPMRADFIGPFRRLDDPIDGGDSKDKLQKGLQSVLRKAVQHSGDLMASLSSDAPNVRPLHQAVSEIQNIATDLEDRDVSAVCDLLLDQIAIINANQVFAPSTLMAHHDALFALTECSPTQKREREDILASLHRLIHQARAA